MTGKLIAAGCLLVLGATSLCAEGSSSAKAAAARPNILFILADDLAWSDLGCYGHPWHQTPNLDRFAKEGMRFTDAYAPAPICSASRASILTGKTTARLRFEFVTKDKPGRQEIEGEVAMRTPPFTLDLPLEEETIAEVLANAGYDTCFAGKWHLNRHHKRYLGWSPTHGPGKQGFATTIDTFGAHPYGWRDKKISTITEEGVFPRDVLTERAIAFMRQEREAPFFLMASLYFVHTPVKTSCAWLVDKYESLVPEDSPNREKRVKYGAFIETMDHYVGQLIDRVEKAGVRDETLIVFTSDNGGHPEYTANGPLRGSKWNLYEGGIRVPFIARWPGKVAPGTKSTEPVIGYDLLPTFAEIAGAKVTEGLDGLSMTRVLEGGSWPEERRFLWHFPYYHPERGFKNAIDRIGINDFAVSKTRPQSAVRAGYLKVLYFHEDQRYFGYDLRTELGESKETEYFENATDYSFEEMRAALKRLNARMPECLPE